MNENNTQDSLNRENFIKSVEKIVELTKHKGFSIGINGIWGCGKTFVLNELENKLNDGPYLIFHYNCWKYDYYEEPLIALLYVIVQELNLYRLGKKSIKAISDALLTTIIDTFEFEIPLLAGVTQKVKTLKNIRGFLKKIHNFDDRFYENYKKKLQISDDFNSYIPYEKTLNLVSTGLNKLSETNPVIIVVDELDRCLPEYAIKVLERLHHLTEFSNFTLLLAYDKEKLAGSICKTFGMSFENKTDRINYASDYLKKFVKHEFFLNNGTFAKNSLSVFDDYENLDKNPNYIKEPDFIVNLATELFKLLDKRTLDKVLNEMHLIHELSQDKTQIDYILLLAEFLYCYSKTELNIELIAIDYSSNGKIYFNISTRDAIKKDSPQQELLNVLLNVRIVVKYTGTIYRINEYNEAEYLIDYFFPSVLQLEYAAEDKDNRRPSHIDDKKAFFTKFKETYAYIHKGI